MGMGMGKEKPRKIWRGLKTLFFLLSMFASFLLFSAPLLIVLADALLPSAFFTAFLSPFSFQSLSSHFQHYDFWTSIIDVPLISIARSIIIICVYCMCDGPRRSRGPYMGVTTLCSLLSVVAVSLKAWVYVARINGQGATLNLQHHDLTVQESWAIHAMFMCSLLLAVGHIVVAYRTSCRERRKLLIYRIDLEAVSACNKGFPTYHKILHHARAM
ncbi:uncharacterized protein LOC131233296 [Magnolia sinica]|uniref:uncharacterized protein LOC131233296 n=1 Tax=Magnolia sinica TaxID=86752 RepID=UPI00265A9C34|nr:uncharacterized protein LOC131233296 [Magnolia sinica]